MSLSSGFSYSALLSVPQASFNCLSPSWAVDFLYSSLINIVEYSAMFLLLPLLLAMNYYTALMPRSQTSMASQNLPNLFKHSPLLDKAYSFPSIQIASSQYFSASSYSCLFTHSSPLNFVFTDDYRFSIVYRQRWSYYLCYGFKLYVSNIYVISSFDSVNFPLHAKHMLFLVFIFIRSCKDSYLLSSLFTSYFCIFDKIRSQSLIAESRFNNFR